MSIRIIKVGAQATIQDGGRKEYQSQGVPIGGAMDEESLVNANMLVGNERDAACIEIAFGQFAMAFTRDCRIAITGSGTQATCNGQVIPPNRQVQFKEGATLTFSPSLTGFWTYLAVAGGISVPAVLGSKSTYLPAQFGGVEGRSLKLGDQLIVHDQKVLQNSDFQLFMTSRWGLASRHYNSQIRMFQGPEWSRLTDTSQRLFANATFNISADSNRMGYRLISKPLRSNDRTELISTPVAKGTIQLTNDGSLIVLMADAQTIGGYPRIGQVASVDLDRLAQKRPGESFHFQMIPYDEACALFLKREQERKKTKASIALKVKYL